MENNIILWRKVSTRKKNNSKTNKDELHHLENSFENTKNPKAEFDQNLKLSKSNSSSSIYSSNQKDLNQTELKEQNQTINSLKKKAFDNQNEKDLNKNIINESDEEGKKRKYNKDKKKEESVIIIKNKKVKQILQKDINFEKK